MEIKAVIFDLDGVIISTDEYHYQGWKKLADQEGIYFDHNINHRLRGVSRMESLAILLEKAAKDYTDEEKDEMANRKNNYYRQLLDNISPSDILPGVMTHLENLKNRGIKIAIGSSSRNAPLILDHIGLNNYFDAVADGNDIKQSKPDPEVFLLAANRLSIDPKYCIVVEDADAGVAAAVRANMAVLAVGAASSNPQATFSAKDLQAANFQQIIKLWAM